MVRTPGFHCQGPGSIPGQGTETPQVSWRSQKKKERINVTLRTQQLAFCESRSSQP